MDCKQKLTREKDQEEAEFLGVTTVSGSLLITLDQLGCLKYGCFLFLVELSSFGSKGMRVNERSCRKWGKIRVLKVLSASSPHERSITSARAVKGQERGG